MQANGIFTKGLSRTSIPKRRLFSSMLLGSILEIQFGDVCARVLVALHYGKLVIIMGSYSMGNHRFAVLSDTSISFPARFLRVFANTVDDDDSKVD